MPQAPKPTPEPGERYNFTALESRMIKAGKGKHFEQSDNAQSAVEVESRLIVGQRVGQAPDDKTGTGADAGVDTRRDGNLQCPC